MDISRMAAIAVLTLALGVGGGAPLRAQAAADTSVVPGRDDTKAQRLFGELMSPYCPGLTLATCPSPGADSLRADIRTRLDRGETPRAIRAAYVSDWGERILGAPPVRHWGIVLWLMPGVLLLLGVAVLTMWLRRLRPTLEESTSGDALLDVGAVTPVDQERLEAELRAFDGAG